MRGSVCARDASRQLARRMHDSTTPVAGILLVAVDGFHVIEPLCLQGILSISFRLGGISWKPWSPFGRFYADVVMQMFSFLFFILRK